MRILLGLLIAVAAITLHAEPVKFEKYGFSIDILDGSPGSAGTQALQMYLPAQNGFAANVNVQIQPYPGSIEEYKKLSDAQFEQLGLKVIQSKIKGDTILFEYAGVMHGHNLHFYSKAIKRGNYFYLATATDSVAGWPANKAQLMKSVDSFEAP